MEKYFDIGFMLIGLGFFLFTINDVRTSQDRDYDRKLNEAREFGYENSRLQKEAQNPRKK